MSSKNEETEAEILVKIEVLKAPCGHFKARLIVEMDKVVVQSLTHDYCFDTAEIAEAEATAGARSLGDHLEKSYRESGTFRTREDLVDSIKNPDKSQNPNLH